MFELKDNLYNDIENVCSEVKTYTFELAQSCLVTGVFGDCYGCDSECVSSCKDGCEGSCEGHGCRNTCYSNSR